jgi:6,7-dimethyl-8-ribityllumazine synthase
MKTKQPSVAIVIAPYHEKIAEKMYKTAVAECEARGYSIVNIVTVPGCFEMPLAVANALDANKLDGVIVLGMIEKGETLHGEVMGHTVFEALLDLQLDTRVPIGMGIIGPGATPKQGLVRAEGSARQAVEAVAAMIANK